MAREFNHGTHEGREEVAGKRLASWPMEKGLRCRVGRMEPEVTNRACGIRHLGMNSDGLG